MPRLTLRYPIHALDHQLLFPSGAFLTKEALDAAISSVGAYSYQEYSLASYDSVKEDCLKFLGSPPYETIFSDKKEIQDFLAILETVHLPVPVLQSLGYFKQKDVHTYAHILVVFALSTLLARDLIPDYRECIQLFAAGPTHDIGKICVPLHILKKTTPLTQTERGFIEHHTVAGYVLLAYYGKGIEPLASKVAIDHHERRDASGYPRGLLLNDPVIEVIAVSDVYDALIRPRPYRSSPYDNRTALEEITKMAEEKKIGWDVVKALIAHNRKSKPHYGDLAISGEKRGSPPPNNVYGMIAEDEST